MTIDRDPTAATTWWQPAAVLAGAIALLLVGVAIGWMLLHGRLAVRAAAAPTPGIEHLRELVEAKRQAAALLEREIVAAQQALAGDQCTAAQPLGAPAGLHGGTRELVAQATVLVIAAKPNGASIGTGFFVTPDRLVTSDRLVDAADPARILVVNRQLDGARPARLVTRSAMHAIGQPDFAVLAVEGARVRPLSLRLERAGRETVVAAALAVADGRLPTAPGEAAPAVDVALTAGRIGETRTLSSGLPILVHTSALEHGAAGGPLTDLCGQVVGVHAQGLTDIGSRFSFDYAIGASALADFLTASGVGFVVADGQCGPAQSAKPG